MDKNYKIEVFEDVAGLGLVKGFKVAGVGCDIRNKNDMSRLDTALIVSDVLATASGVFTTNDVKAAPVLVDMAHLDASSKVKAIIANSGNANACTGVRGMADANETCKFVADIYGVKKEQVLVCSTGRIGEFMPMEKLKSGITSASEKLGNDDQSSINASQAIMTSDTRPKTVLVNVEFGGKKFISMMEEKGYVISILQDGKTIDNKGMIHWEKKYD